MEAIGVDEANPYKNLVILHRLRSRIDPSLVGDDVIAVYASADDIVRGNKEYPFYVYLSPRQMYKAIKFFEEKKAKQEEILKQKTLEEVSKEIPAQKPKEPEQQDMFSKLFNYDRYRSDH